MMRVSDRMMQGQPAVWALYNEQDTSVSHPSFLHVTHETYGEPGGAGARMNVRSKERVPLTGTTVKTVESATTTQQLSQRAGSHIRETRRAQRQI